MCSLSLDYLFDPEIKACTDLIIGTPEFQDCLQEFPDLAAYRTARIIIGHGLSHRDRFIHGHCLTVHKFFHIFSLWISSDEPPVCPYIHKDHLKAPSLL
jgi:hypothetical protein